MKLSEFVSETLLEIEEGLAIVREQNDHSYSITDSSKKGHAAGGSIDFDVAITTLEASGGKAGAGLSVAGIDLVGASVSSKNESAAISRIKFSVGKSQITEPKRRKLL
ncbi:MAG: hypothetical protein Q8O53_01075 [Candidatus Moranbacteria bacterium]|nr:hypothetical protein [Candidatus Moranbacteria bacterium]